MPQLNELLTAYKHLPIVEHMLNTKDEAITEFVQIHQENIQNECYFIIEPTKQFCNATGAISSRIVLTSTYQIKQVECGCLEQYRKKQCVHITLLYALALKILCIKEFQMQLNLYKKAKLTLEQDCILNELATDLRTNAYYFKKIHLTPEVVKEKETHSLSLRIAYDKEYVIKSIAEFIDLMENKKFFSYGQKLSFIHSYEVLDDESKEFYSFLQGIHHEETFKSIQIKKSHFFQILEIYHNKGIYYGNEIRKTQYYRIQELENLNLKLDENYLFIEKPEHTEQLICGINYAYLLGEESIYAYHFKKRNEATIMNSLFRCRDEKGLWIEANAVDFISNVFPLIKKDVGIAESFYQKYQLPNVLIHSYFYYKEGIIWNDYKIDVDEKYLNTPYVAQALDGYEMMLEALGFTFKKNAECALYTLEQQYLFLTADISGLKTYGDVFFDASMKKIKLKKTSRVHVNVSYNVGLLDFKFDETNMSIEEIDAMLDAYHNKLRYVKLKNDVILEVKETDAKELNNFLEDFNLTEKKLSPTISKPLNYILKLVDGISEPIHFDETIYQMIKTIRGYKESKTMPPMEFQSIMRPYQIEAFQWISMLANFGFGGILADDMGLGKTLEILSFLAYDTTLKPSLIVCPMSLIYNWQNECSKWNLSAPVQLIIGSAPEREEIIHKIPQNKKVIYITSYDSLRRDVEQYSVQFRLIVADEAQYIKNQNTLKSTAIKQIQAELHFALTGTPIENGLADLWSIFDYLMPGYLSNYHHFKTRYETLIMEDDIETLTLLKKRVQPFILRRTKKDVLTELPSKTEEIYYCKMEGKQEEIYKTYVEKIKNDLQQDGPHVLALITRLRQICISPRLLFEEDIPSAKLNLALELITRAISSNHRILIFSQFSSIIPILASMLESEGISYYSLDGKTPSQKRIELVNDFNRNQRIQVFLISLKAGGTGLNLTGADMVIHLDPWWNVSVEHQATDRAYRIGQTKNVHVLKLVCMNSIEEKVMLLQHLKNTLADQILKNEKLSLTKNDILDLIS